MATIPLILLNGTTADANEVMDLFYEIYGDIDETNVQPPNKTGTGPFVLGNAPTINNPIFTGVITGGTITNGVFTGTTTFTGFTPGSVLFIGASSVLSQDNSNLFWDDTNNRLGIGTTSPQTPIHTTGSVTNGGFDFILGNTDQATRGNSGASRALVKNTGNRLEMNFANDYTGGSAFNNGTIVFSPAGAISVPAGQTVDGVDVSAHIHTGGANGPVLPDYPRRNVTESITSQWNFTNSLTSTNAADTSPGAANRAMLSARNYVVSVGRGNAGGGGSLAYNVGSVIRTGVGSYQVTQTFSGIGDSSPFAIPFNTIASAVSAAIITGSAAGSYTIGVIDDSGFAFDSNYYFGKIGG